MGELNVRHLEDYLDRFSKKDRYFGDLGPGTVSRSYVETQYRRLKRFFNWMKARDYVTTNPLGLIPHPKIGKRVIPTFTDQQITSLLEQINPLKATPGRQFQAIRNRAMLVLLIDTPGRRAELAQLQIGDVDLDGGTSFGHWKGDKQRWMHLGDASKAALKTYMEARAVRLPDTDALWISLRNWPMDITWIPQMLKRAAKKAGISQAHLHMFRHTFAVAWIRAGEPLRTRD